MQQAHEAPMIYNRRPSMFRSVVYQQERGNTERWREKCFEQHLREPGEDRLNDVGDCTSKDGRDYTCKKH